MRKAIDLTGQRFGHWIVDKRAASSCPTRHSYRWHCRCDCGNEKEVSGNGLRMGKTRSCGCLRREMTVARSTTHGLSAGRNRHPLYDRWEGIKQRTGDPGSQSYPRYGGRGITMDPRWRADFTVFLADLLAEIGECPPNPPGWNAPISCYSLDRIDNDGNYEPGNLRWATHKMQANNTSHARTDLDASEIIKLYEQGATTRAIGKLLGCDHSTVLDRLHEAGVTLRVGSPPKLSLDMSEMRRLYEEEGLDAITVGERLGCGNNVVLQRLRKAGVTIRKRGNGRVYTQRALDVPAMRALREQGLSYEAIAERVGCSTTTAWKRLQD